MKHIEDEVSLLVYERIAGTISEEDNLFLEQMLNSDPVYREMYNDLSAKLKNRAAADEILDIDEQAAWEKVKGKLSEVPEQGRSKNIFYKRAVGVAASGLLILSVSLYFLYRKSDKSREAMVYNAPLIEFQLASGEKVKINDSANKVIYAGNVKLNAGIKELSFKSSSSKNSALNSLIIPRTLTYRVILSDGTAILLNSSSKLRFPLNFQGATREVYLEGEAYFEVAKNPDRPFIVHTPLTDIKVLGTTFNVSAYGSSSVTTSLLEGSVSTNSKNKQELKLKPGMQAIYSFQHGFSKNKFEPDQVVSWIDGIYNFHATRLQDIAPIIERWFDVRINFATNTAADLRITGTIDKKLPLQVFLNNLKASANVNAVVEKGQLSISKLD